MTDLQMYANAYATRGMPIFPVNGIIDGSCTCRRPDCKAVGKHPLTRRGVHDSRPGAEAQIKGWWKQWPDANIALATGEKSGLYVVDLDGQQGIDEWFLIQSKYGFVNTLSARTGGGGRHLFFRLPNGHEPLRNRAKSFAESIDTRGDGGYVLIAPSQHRSGKRYEWENKLKAVEMPKWLIDLWQEDPLSPDQIARRDAHRAQAVWVRRDGDVGIRILNEEADKVRAAGEGQRNHTLFKSTAASAELAWGGEMTMSSVIDTMRSAASAAGLDRSEADKTIRSAINRAQRNPRTIRTRN